MDTAYTHGVEFKHHAQVIRDEPTHNVVVAYLFWVFGWMGAHRFFLGHQITGLLYLFTFGLLGIGWLVDAFLIPRLCRESSNFYLPGKYDYNLTWLLFAFLGFLGMHRFYLGKWVTGIIYLCTGGLLGLGLLFDLFFLNEEINERNKVKN